MLINIIRIEVLQERLAQDKSNLLLKLKLKTQQK
jgi:hypothetical protein